MPIAELTAIFIKGRARNGTPYRVLAEDYGYSVATISRVISGKAKIATPRPERRCQLPGCRNHARSRFCCVGHAALHRAGRTA